MSYIVKEIKQYQERWLQHVQRMNTNRLPKQALQYKPKRRRNIRRPRKRWKDQLHLEDQGTGNTPKPSGTWWWWCVCPALNVLHKKFLDILNIAFFVALLMQNISYKTWGDILSMRYSFQKYCEWAFIVHHNTFHKCKKALAYDSGHVTRLRL